MSDNSDDENEADARQVVEVRVPDVGEGVAEVELVSWAVEPGQRVTRHQIIAEVMTDKATVEVPSPVEGLVAELSGAVGDVLLVGSTLFTLDVEGDVAVAAAAPKMATTPPDRTHRPVAEAAPPPTVTPPAAPTPTPRPASPPPAPVPAAAPSNGGPAAPRMEGRRPTASPAVRRRARDAGIDLRTLTGSGPAGRITHDDLDAAFAGRTSNGTVTAAAARSADTTVTDQPIIGIRRKIAERMVTSTTTIPHITYVDEVDVTALEELRQTLNVSPASQAAAGSRPKLTLLPFLVRALVEVVPDFPVMNAHVVEAEPDQPSVLRTFGGVHVGIATQTEAGLVVPVIRHAEAETIWSTAARVADLATTARAGTAAPADLGGSTITITSLGPLGGLVSTPVINKPEVAIVGVNKIVTRPMWDGRDFVPRKMMNLSSSFDHRVADGWDAARFIQAIKRLLEQPALLFIGEEGS